MLVPLGKHIKEMVKHCTREKGVRKTAIRNSPAFTKLGEGKGGGAPDPGAQILLQPGRIILKQFVLYSPWRTTLE